MDRLLSAPSVSKQALKCQSSHELNPAMCAEESNLHSMGTSVGSMDESDDGETSSVEGAKKLPSPSPSVGGEPAAGRDCSSARSGESLVFHDSDGHHEASDASPELESDGEESSCSSDRRSFDWLRYTHSPLPVLVRDQQISPQKEKASFHNQSPTSPEERCTLNAEGLRTKAGVNEISRERMNASLSPSPSFSSSCESAASIQEEGCGQPRKHHNKYLNFDHSIVILPPPPSPLSYSLFDLSASSEDEENPPTVSRSVRRKLAAQAERQRCERRDRAEQKEREEREERRQKRELALQPLRVRYEQWKIDHAKEQEELRIARETEERLEREFLEWRLISAQQNLNEERESEGQEITTKKVKKNRWWMVKRWWKGNHKEKEQTWQWPPAWGEEEEEDEIDSIEWAVPTLQPKKRRKIQFGWKGFGKKSKKKKEKKKERHQLEEEQAWANEDWQQGTPKPKKRKNIEIVWKGFGKRNKKAKKKQRHHLEEEQVGPSVWAGEDGQLPTENVEPTPRVKRSQKQAESVWRGFGKKKKRQEKNQEHDQLEEEAGTSVRAEVEREETLAMQSQKPKKTKRKGGLFPKLFENKKKKTERYVEQEHLRDEAGLSVRVEEVKPSPSDRAEPTSKAKKSKNKPGLFSKLFAKKKKKGKDYQQQLEETTESGGAEGPAYGSPAPERDLSMDETDQEALSSMPRRHRTSSFTDIL